MDKKYNNALTDQLSKKNIIKCIYLMSAPVFMIKPSISSKC